MGLFNVITLFINHGRFLVTGRWIWSTTWEFVANFFRSKNRYTGDANLTGKVVVITGANTGIGRVTTIEMVKRGANVIVGCRDMEKGNKTVNDIWEKQPKAKLKLIQLDLASLESVRVFAKHVASIVPYIDILINNAGVLDSTKSKTEDGFELHFGTNYLGHFLLTMLLLDQLRAAPKARVVMVASKDYMFGKINFKDIHFEKRTHQLKAYAQSKLAVILFAQELSKRLVGTNITTYSLNPGRVRTQFYRNYGLFENFIVTIIEAVIFQSTALGVQTTLYCALEESVVHESGRYYDNCKLVEKTTSSVNDTDASKLWFLSCEMVKLENRLRLL